MIQSDNRQTRTGKHHNMQNVDAEQTRVLDNSEPQISIVIISYNTRDLTLACLKSIYRNTRSSFQIVVFDNASKDGSAQAIELAFPDVHLIKSSQNHGFGGAHRYAVAASSAPWLLLLNPDTIIHPGALDQLLQFAQDTPQAGIWGGRTVFDDGRLNPSSCWSRMTMWSLFCAATGASAAFKNSSAFNPEGIGGWQRDTVRQVDIVSGALMMLKRETWERLGGFDPAFFMYGEDADLCLRARQIGLRPTVTPSVTIVHYGGASEPVRSAKIIRLLKAKRDLVRRHFPPYSRWLGLILLSASVCSRLLAYRSCGAVMRKTEWQHAGQVWREVWQNKADWM